MNRKAFTVAFLVISAAQAQNAATGSQGIIRDESGVAVKNAIVSYYRIPKYLPREPGHGGSPVLAPGETMLSGNVSAAANGAYQALSLPPGDYGVCAHHATEPYLDPCKWGSALQVTTQPSLIGTAGIILKKGVFLRVHVSDPNHWLAPTSILRADLTVGVMFGSGGFHSAMIVGSASSGRDYHIAVPAGQALTCWIWPGDYTLSDEKGVTVAAEGAQLPFQATAGVDEVFSFTVTGKSGVH